MYQKDTSFKSKYVFTLCFMRLSLKIFIRNILIFSNLCRLRPRIADTEDEGSKDFQPRVMLPGNILVGSLFLLGMFSSLRDGFRGGQGHFLIEHPDSNQYVRPC